MNTVPIRPGGGVRPVGWLALAFASSLVALYGLARFGIEFGISPLHYVVEDALFALLGVLGAWAATARLRTARARERAARPRVVVADGRGLPGPDGDDAIATGAGRFEGTHFEATATRVHLLTQVIAAGLLLACGCFLLAGAILGKDTPWLWLAGPVLVYFGLAALGAAVRVQLSAKPTLRMDGTGIEHLVFGAVPWSGVTDLRLRQVPGPKGSRHPVLELQLAPGTPVTGRPIWALPRWPADVLQVPLRGLDQPPERIHAAAAGLRDRGGPPRGAATPWFGSARMRESIRQQSELLARLEALGGESGFNEADAAQSLQLIEALGAATRDLQAARLVEDRRLRRITWMFVLLAALAVLAVLWLLAHAH